ncbi:MAG: hypothetical protein JWL94_1105 [Microbacteriaceae bacterium]|jgi:D-alanyl-D-alanine carboxypeptidase|nr:hypothetical protein [Microbacteriaceae bacterium]HEV7957290.1 M15 family metallopeptidase [Marisediminicola sp.]
MAEPAARGIRTVVLAGGLAMLLVACDAAAPEAASPPPRPAGSVSPSAAPIPSPILPPTFDRALYSVDDPASIWVVTNKARPLDPLDHVPPDLVTAEVPFSANSTMRVAAARAIVELFAAAALEGAGDMQVQNAYRSFENQTSLHNSLVVRLGQEKARAQSARPGYSEHQTGLSVDIIALPEACSIQACFGDTAQGAWLAENAWRFGFILRYPADKTPVTGYIYEPWHFRYVGVELATEMHETGLTTLEEFFGLPAAPDYAR